MLREVQVESAPTLTIGMPVYNGAKYIDEAVESILTQTYRDFELIISDNASTDDTESIGRALRRARSTGDVPAQQAERRAQREQQPARPARPRPAVQVGAVRRRAPARLPGTVRGRARRRPERRARAIPAPQFVDGDGAPLDITDPGWHLVSDDPSERLLFAIRADQCMNAILGVIRTDALRRTRLLPRYAGGDYRLIAELSLLGQVRRGPGAALRPADPQGVDRGQHREHHDGCAPTGAGRGAA